MKVFPSLLMQKLFTYLPLPKKEPVRFVPVMGTAGCMIGVHLWFIPIHQL